MSVHPFHVVVGTGGGTKSASFSVCCLVRIPSYIGAGSDNNDGAIFVGVVVVEAAVVTAVATTKQ